MAYPSSNQQQLQQTWVPYEAAKDCSQGFCSIYCPQWCYIMFPPPPPFSFSDDDDGNNGPTTAFSPLVIAIIGILASAFLLVTYYAIISKYCGGFRRRRHHHDHPPDLNSNSNDNIVAGLDHNNSTWHNSSVDGLDDALISKIQVYRFRRSEGVVIGVSDCSVCLGEFKEEESLRLLPKCGHAFHVQCIDTWLRSHSNCPLCRASIFAATLDQTTDDHHEQEEAEPEAVIHVVEDAAQHDQASDRSDDNDDQLMRRSFSVDSLSQGGRVSIADILQAGEEEEEEESERGDDSKGSSHGTARIKRSLSSSGRFGFARQGKGRSTSVLPL